MFESACQFHLKQRWLANVEKHETYRGRTRAPALQRLASWPMTKCECSIRIASSRKDDPLAGVLIKTLTSALFSIDFRQEL